MKDVPYPQYKPSGVEWIGDMPTGWNMKRLKLNVRLGNEKGAIDDENPLPFVGLENVESWTGKLLFNGDQSVSEGVSNFFRSGDTLFGKLRPYLAKACNVNFDGFCSSDLLVMKEQKLNRTYLLYTLLSEGFIGLVDSSSYGVKMPRASWDFIGSIGMPVPSDKEQDAIASFLDRETAKIDALVGKRQELIGKLKEKRTALISRTVTCGLPPDAAKAAGLNPHPKLKPSGVEWLGEIPEHWSTIRLRRIASRIETGSTPPTVEASYYEDGTVPWFGPGSFGDSISLTMPVKYIHASAVADGVARMFKKNATMVVTIGATLGKVSSLSENGSCNQQITVVEFDENKIYSRFGTYQLKGLESVLRGIAPSATLPIFSQGDIADIPLCNPPILEQRTIADYLDRDTAKIDRMVEMVEAAIEKLQEYRTALITAAVTGKIDVRKAL